MLHSLHSILKYTCEAKHLQIYQILSNGSQILPISYVCCPRNHIVAVLGVT